MKTPLALLALLCLAAPRAWALGGGAPLDLDLFHPGAGPGKLLVVDTAAVGEHLTLSPQLFFNYGDRPLVFLVGGQAYAVAVRHRFTTDLSVSFSLWRRLQVALEQPVSLDQGDNLGLAPLPPMYIPPSGAAAGQQDLRLRLKGVIIKEDATRVVDRAFGVAGNLSLPTGNADSYLGSVMPTFELRLVGHLRWSRFTGALNLGWRFASTASLLATSTGMGPVYSLGLQAQVLHRDGAAYYLVGELYGRVVLSQADLNAPLEYLLSFKATQRGWSFYAGLGSGTGPGVPQVRAVAGVTWVIRWVKE